MVNLHELLARLESGQIEPGDVDGQPILSVVVYETERSKAELYLLRRGQRIPAHHHSAIDDVFVGVRGRAQIRVWDSSGSHVDHVLEPGALVVVQPSTGHEVSCLDDDVAYVLTQSPKEQYDIHRFEHPGS
jgi:quercetin dioxygenase-like cupin family protein